MRATSTRRTIVFGLIATVVLGFVWLVTSNRSAGGGAVTTTVVNQSGAKGTNTVTLRLTNTSKRPVEVLGVLVEAKNESGEWAEVADAVVDSFVQPQASYHVSLQGMSAGRVYRVKVSHFYEVRGLSLIMSRAKSAWRNRRISDLWQSGKTSQWVEGLDKEFSL